MTSRALPALLLLAACGGTTSLADARGQDGLTPDASTTTPDGGGGIQPTATGTPVGLPVTVHVDLGGATITSSDGGFELDIPADDLDGSDVTITPITDHAPLGIATAYRITMPALATPATAIFHLPAEVAQAGDTGTLFVASQDAQGYWNALGPATWDGSGAATATAITTTGGDLALTSCLGLVVDKDLVLSGATAHLTVTRQCDSAPASGKIGATATATDPVSWSNTAYVGGTGLGALTPSGATATFVSPQTAPSGDPRTILSATVQSAALRTRAVNIQRTVAVAGWVTWEVDGKRFVGVQGSTVLSQNGKSVIAASDNVNPGSLNLQFPGAGLGGFDATYLDSETPGPTSTIAYIMNYTQPCTTNQLSTTIEVDVTNALTTDFVMSGRFSGQAAVMRGTIQCQTGPETDVQFVSIDGVFTMPWQSF